MLESNQLSIVLLTKVQSFRYTKLDNFGQLHVSGLLTELLINIATQFTKHSLSKVYY